MNPDTELSREKRSEAEMNSAIRNFTFTGQGFWGAAPPSAGPVADWTLCRLIYQSDLCASAIREIEEAEANLKDLEPAQLNGPDNTIELKLAIDQLAELQERQSLIAEKEDEAVRLIRSVSGPISETGSVAKIIESINDLVGQIDGIPRGPVDVLTDIARQRDKISQLRAESIAFQPGKILRRRGGTNDHPDAVDARSRIDEPREALVDQEVKSVRSLKEVAERLVAAGHRVAPVFMLADGPGQIDPDSKLRKSTIDGLTGDPAEISNAMRNLFPLPRADSNYYPPLVSDFALSFKRPPQRRAGLYIEMVAADDQPDAGRPKQRYYYYWFRETGLQLHCDPSLPIRTPALHPRDSFARLGPCLGPRKNLPASEKNGRARAESNLEGELYRRDLEQRLVTLFEQYVCEPSEEGWRELAIRLAMRHEEIFKIDLSDIPKDLRRTADRDYHIRSLFASVMTQPEQSIGTAGETLSGHSAAKRVLGILDQESVLERAYGFSVSKSLSRETLRRDHLKPNKEDPNGHVLPAFLRRVLRFQSVFSELLLVASNVSGRSAPHLEAETERTRQE